MKDQGITRELRAEGVHIPDDWVPPAWMLKGLWNKTMVKVFRSGLPMKLRVWAYHHLKTAYKRLNANTRIK